MNTRSRMRKQAEQKQPVDSTKRENVPSGTAQMLKPTFESTRIEATPAAERMPASPEKCGFEDDIFEHGKRRRDFSVQVSLCQSCNSGRLRSYWKTFLVALILIVITFYHKEISKVALWGEYARKIEIPSTNFAWLKLNEYAEYFRV